MACCCSGHWPWHWQGAQSAQTKDASGDQADGYEPDAQELRGRAMAVVSRGPDMWPLMGAAKTARAFFAMAPTAEISFAISFGTLPVPLTSRTPCRIPSAQFPDIAATSLRVYIPLAQPSHDLFTILFLRGGRAGPCACADALTDHRHRRPISGPQVHDADVLRLRRRRNRGRERSHWLLT